jgi:hypothetical protein
MAAIQTIRCFTLHSNNNKPGGLGQLHWVAHMSARSTDWGKGQDRPVRTSPEDREIGKRRVLSEKPVREPFSIIYCDIFVGARRHLFWHGLSYYRDIGLLITAAKASFDTKSTQIKQITANLILLDNLLAQYGPEAMPLRKAMRDTITPFVDRVWHEKATKGHLQPPVKGKNYT